MSTVGQSTSRKCTGGLGNSDGVVKVTIATKEELLHVQCTCLRLPKPFEDVELAGRENADGVVYVESV